MSEDSVRANLEALAAPAHRRPASVHGRKPGGADLLGTNLGPAPGAGDPAMGVVAGAAHAARLALPLALVQVANQPRVFLLSSAVSFLLSLYFFFSFSF